MSNKQHLYNQDSHHNNNFTSLRLIAAFFVLVSHSFGILDKGLLQPIIWKGHSLIILSDVGLAIFFTISGYLVTESLLNSDSYKQYLWKRFLRIVPGLIAVNLFCIILGSILTTHNSFDYFLHKETWRYLLKNSTLIINQFTLPAVFTQLHNNSINASIWTIGLEVKFYILLMLSSVFLLLNNRTLLLIGFILFQAIRIYTRIINPIEIPGFDPEPYFQFGSYFYLGVLYCRYKDEIPLSWWYANILLAIAYVTANTPYQAITFSFFLAYSTLIIGNSRAVINLKGNDISYGFYLYAFPVQQVVLLASGYAIDPWLHIFISTIIATIFGILSWKFIERPLMRKKTIIK